MFVFFPHYFPNHQQITKSLRIFEERNVDSTAHAMVYEDGKGWITKDATKVAREWTTEIKKKKKKKKKEEEVGGEKSGETKK